MRVIPAFDELEHHELGLGMRAKGGPIDQLTFERLLLVIPDVPQYRLCDAMYGGPNCST